MTSQRNEKRICTMTNRPPLSPPPGLLKYRKRRKRTPNLFVILAGVLILGGIALLVSWLAGPDRPLGMLFATETPTPTLTSTATNTLEPTATATETLTPTITPTPTFSTPFNYTVQEGDSLAVIVNRFDLGDDGIELILLLNPYDAENGIGIDPATQIIIPGQIILLPNPGMQLPTATPIPPDLPRGTRITYTIKAGDTLAGIALLFNSTVEEIISVNNLTDPNAIFVGQQLIVPANLVTPVPTRLPTSTPITPGPGTVIPTASPTPIN